MLDGVDTSTHRWYAWAMFVKIVFAPKALPWIGAEGTCDICGTIFVLTKEDTPQGTGPLGRETFYYSCPSCGNVVECKKQANDKQD